MAWNDHDPEEHAWEELGKKAGAVVDAGMVQDVRDRSETNETTSS